MDPYYAIHHGEEHDEFVLLIVYSARKDNMVAWLAARNDGERTGVCCTGFKAVFDIWSGRSSASIKILKYRSSSLCGARGSEVMRGNLLVVPIANTLLLWNRCFSRLSKAVCLS